MGVDSVAIDFERVPLHSGNYAATMSLCLRANGNRGRPLNIYYIIICSFGQRTSACLGRVPARAGEGGEPMNRVSTAKYRIMSDAGGNRYRFYCDASGVLACCTKSYHAETPEQELRLAWEREGSQAFNRCNKCGRYVIDAMFNAEVLECVECAPFEGEPAFCKTCGLKIETPGRHRNFASKPWKSLVLGQM